MKNRLSASLLVILLSALTLIMSGCGFFNQPGETAQEVHREHLRILRLSQQQLIRDLDRAGHFDRPSRLSEMRLNP